MSYLRPAAAADQVMEWRSGRWQGGRSVIPLQITNYFHNSLPGQSGADFSLVNLWLSGARYADNSMLFEFGGNFNGTASGAASVMFTLTGAIPVGFRPSTNQTRYVIHNPYGIRSRVDLQTNGNLVMYRPASVVTFTNSTTGRWWL